MADSTLVAASWFLNQQVTTYDQMGNVVSDDGAYQRSGAEKVYVFAEFLASKGLLMSGVDSTRRPDLELKFSDLTEQGQAFAKFALHKWMKAMDRQGLKPIDSTGLERHWDKFRSQPKI